jgi:bifunctional DNA-binding transcriptional regulator/antitoxin component of YhaV-PrlF toxin-antitoxin module
MGTTQDSVEYRKTQAIFGNSTFGIVIPKNFVNNLGIAKGDYLRITQEGSHLIIEKAEVSN